MQLVDLLMQPTKLARRYSPLREDLTEGQEQELLFMYNRVREGEHRDRIRDERTYASADPAVRAAYSEDSVAYPDSIDQLIKRTPGAVVLPREDGELLELLRFGQRNQVPIVPRGGGTSVHGGCVPVEGGVVADLRGMNEVHEVDPDEGTVTVEAGCTWLDLEDEVDAEGFSVRSMPDTAPQSTVGGAIAMDKADFGAFGHGSIRDQLVEVTLLTPDLEVVNVRGEDLDLVVGCQGATGFILDATLDLVEDNDLLPVGATFDTVTEVQRFLKSLPTDGVETVQVLGPNHVDLTLEATGERRALPTDTRVVALTLDEEEAEALVPDLQARVDTIGGEWMDEDEAAWAHEHRFEHRTYKRLGPSLVVAEAEVPVDSLADAWWAGEDAVEAPEHAIRAVATGPDTLKLTATVLCDERLPGYSLAWGNRLAFVDAVKDEGGSATAPGLLTPGEAKPVLGKDRVKRLSSYRKERDPENIMNPGKVLPAPVKGLPIVPTSAAVVPGVALMKGLRGQFDHRRGSTTEPSNRALKTVMGRRHSRHLAEVSDGLYGCSGLGHTNRVGDLHEGIEFIKEQPRTKLRAYRFDTQLPRGIVAAARAILEGAEPTRQLASHALSLPAVPTYENASQNDTPILPAIEGVREAAQRADRFDPRVKELVADLEETGNVLGEDPEARGAWMPGGAPSGVDTTTLLVTSDTAAYERGDDASRLFNVLQNAGFGFTTLGADEPHLGTVPYRLGAVDAATDTLTTFADRAVERMEDPPKTLVTASSEDADVARRRLPDLLHRTEHEAWQPDVVTATEVLADLVRTGRLTFEGAGDDEADEAEGDDGEAPEEAEAEEDEEPAEGEDEAAEEPEGADEEDDAGFEELDVTLVHSPFATDDEREALATVAEAIPALEHDEADLDDELIPDVAYALVNENQAEALGFDLKPALAGSTALVGCVDLAYVLDELGIDVRTVHDVVAERMETRQGGAQLDVGAGEDEEEGFVEHEIPDDAHRVELVKEEAAIPVYPDESILDAAEGFGFEDLPYDCRAGSCVSCAARYEGSPPDQSQAQAISDDEQESHCLTCVSKPTGDVKVWTGEQP